MAATYFPLPKMTKSLKRKTLRSCVCMLCNAAEQNQKWNNKVTTLEKTTRYNQDIQSKQEIWANAHETRESLWQFRFSSLAENWGVQAKLIYKYVNKSLSGSHNDSSLASPCKWYRLVSQPEIAKKSIKPPILAFKVIQVHWIRRQSRATVRLPIND